LRTRAAKINRHADRQLEAAPVQPSPRYVRLGGNELRGWRKSPSGACEHLQAEGQI
jgi:hypothetical protein